jgi:hypothetical protein
MVWCSQGAPQKKKKKKKSLRHLHLRELRTIIHQNPGGMNQEGGECADADEALG